MTLKIVGLGVTLCLMTWIGPADVEAGSISRNNPYRSFNISGVNYGADQWEREHRQPQTVRPQAAPVRGRRGFLFRRG